MISEHMIQGKVTLFAIHLGRLLYSAKQTNVWLVVVKTTNHEALHSHSLKSHTKKKTYFLQLGPWVIGVGFSSLVAFYTQFSPGKCPPTPGVCLDLHARISGCAASPGVQSASGALRRPATWSPTPGGKRGSPWLWLVVESPIRGCLMTGSWKFHGFVKECSYHRVISGQNYPIVPRPQFSLGIFG